MAHGCFMAITGWMVRAWVVPGSESPDGVFSHENPDLPVRGRHVPHRRDRSLREIVNAAR